MFWTIVFLFYFVYLVFFVLCFSCQFPYFLFLSLEIFNPFPPPFKIASCWAPHLHWLPKNWFIPMLLLSWFPQLNKDKKQKQKRKHRTCVGLLSLITWNIKQFFFPSFVFCFFFRFFFSFSLCLGRINNECISDKLHITIVARFFWNILFSIVFLFF